MQHIPWDIETTADGSLTLRHHQHQESYHSKVGALKEARDLYIVASGIEKSFQDSERREIKVLDVGLGLGYNALSTLEAWYNLVAPTVDLRIISGECNRDLVNALCSGVAPWQSNWQPHWLDWSKGLTALVSGELELKISHPHSSKVAIWHIVVADLLTMVFNDAFDFIWQDPFSPKNNPQLWSMEWFEKLRHHTQTGGQLLTYSVARQVRDHLTAAGWRWQLIPTTGSKKNWLKAFLQ